MKNNKTKLIKLLAALAGVVSTTTATAQLEMGGWQTHFSYRNINQLVQTPEKIYAESNGNIFSVDKSYNSIETYSKITGLSDGNITKIAYDESKDLMVICYSNLKIDIIKNGVIYKFTEIADKEMSSKTLNNVSFGKKYVYLSMGFGIVTINTQKMEIADTYIIGDKGSYISVLQTQETADSIFALTDGKIYSADINDKNLANYQHWTVDIAPEKKLTSMAYFNGKLNLLGNNWYVKEGNNWRTPEPDITNISSAHVSGNYLTLTSKSKNTVAIINKDYKIDTLMGGAVNDAVYDAKSRHLWKASDSLRYISRESGRVDNAFLPDGPSSNTVVFMKMDAGNILSGVGQAYGDKATLQIFDTDQWSQISYDDIIKDNADVQFKAIWDACYDPKDPRRLYVGTWFNIFEFYDNQFVKQYTRDNTPFTGGASTQVEKLLKDKDGYLWALNTNAGELFHCMDPAGEWHTITSSSVYKLFRASDFIITKKNNLKVMTAYWISSQGRPCVHIMQSGSKPYSIANQKTFTSFNISDGSTVSPSHIYCVAEDNNGELWVGTDVGPIVMKNLANVFNSNYTANRIKLTRSDDASLADYLLATEQINSIAVDGANRKWIGTYSSGAYLLSSDGQKTIHHFTKDNSPLTTNSITSIAIEPNTGMVYISTPDGMFSFKSDAAEGKKTLDDVHVYPNPIRPNYFGDITITGLMEDTEVRITDMQGHVVSHGKSNGSVYTWNGYLADGRHASTGIYYVFQATQDGENSNVAKFAIIKK